jgi:LmbE family N-acetylglucosaminyl deacetylase
MDLAGISPARLFQLDIADQRATHNLPSIIARLAALFAVFDIEVVLTHPFEGGHPDHDATCLAVHAAARLLAQAEISSPGLIEMAFYHADAKGLVVQRFLGEDDLDDSHFELDAEAWDRKQAMLEKFATQRATLTAFRSRIEPLRPAPRYDFPRMPNEGVLHYDRFDFGVTGAQWQESARRALREYGLPSWVQD